MITPNEHPTIHLSFPHTNKEEAENTVQHQTDGTEGRLGTVAVCDLYRRSRMVLPKVSWGGGAQAVFPKPLARVLQALMQGI